MDSQSQLSYTESSQSFRVIRVDNARVYYTETSGEGKPLKYVQMNRIRVWNRECSMKDIGEGDRIRQDISKSQGFLLELQIAQVSQVNNQSITVKTCSKTDSQSFKVVKSQVGLKDKLVWKGMQVRVLIRYEKVVMIVFESGKTLYLTSISNTLNSYQNDSTLKQLKTDPNSILKQVKQYGTPQIDKINRCVIGTWLKNTSQLPELKLKDCVKSYVKQSKGSKTKVRIPSLESQLLQGPPSIDPAYKPFDVSDFTRTKFDIDLLKRMYKDPKGFIDSLSTSFSSFRYCPYSSNSLYKLIGMGYLEHICYNPTPTLNLYNFINKVRPSCSSSSDIFSRSGSILLNYLLKLQEKLILGKDLGLNKLFHDDTFFNAYTSYLKHLTAQEMSKNSLPSEIYEIQTLSNFYPNIHTYTYLSQALSIKIVFYNIEFCKIQDHGLPSSQIVLYLTQKCNKQAENRNYELLYFKYQDNLELNSKELGCSMCGKLPHETLFDNIFHWCCLNCKALMMLRGSKECENCGYWFNDYQVKGIHSRLYECTECKECVEFDMLYAECKVDRLMCKICYRSKSCKTSNEKYVEDKTISEYEAKSEPESVEIESSTSTGSSSDMMNEDAPRPRVITCQICSGNHHKLTLKCLHVFCKSCILSHFQEQMSKSVFPVGCPECDCPMSKHDVRTFCQPEIAEAYIRKHAEYRIPCFSCKQMRNFKSLVKLGCGHEFDNDCLESHFRSVIGKNLGLIRCPAGCPQEVDIEIIELNLSPLYFHKYQKLAAEQRKRIDAGMTCQMINCGESSSEESYVKFNCEHSVCRSCSVLELISQIKKKRDSLSCPVCEEVLFQTEYEELIDSKLLSRYRETVQGMVI